MNGLLILGLLLFIPGQCGANANTPAPNDSQAKTTVITNPSPNTSNHIKRESVTSEASSTSITTTTTTSVKITTTTKSFPFHFKPECRELYLLSGILLLFCFIFVISTLMLLCKVCQLRKRLSTIGQPVNLSPTEYWVQTKDKSKPDSEREAKESTMLMADLSPAQVETNNGTIKEDGEKVKEDEQTPEEKEVGDAANSKEASATPVTAAENSPSPKPQETTDPQPSQAVEAASSEGKEEPDVEKK